MAGDAEFGNNCNIPKKSKQKKNILSITGVILVPHQCAMRPADLDNNSLLLCHSTYDSNIFLPLFLWKELESIETIEEALH
jgi:hypothetical protein